MLRLGFDQNASKMQNARIQKKCQQSENEPICCIFFQVVKLQHTCEPRKQPASIDRSATSYIGHWGEMGV